MPRDPRFRLLQFAPRYSFRPSSGAELRNCHLALQTARYMSVTHLAFSEPGAAPAAGAVEVVTVLRTRQYHPSDLLRGLVGRTPFSVLNYTSKEMRRELAALLQRRAFHAVQLESVHLAGYLPLLKRAPGSPPIVCDWHNVESEVLARYAERERRLARRLYARISACKLRAFERRFLDRCDLHIAVSERDRAALLSYGTGRPVEVIENGVDVAYFSEPEMERAYAGFRDRAPKPQSRLLFVGSMDYHANVEAVREFARETWPLIRTELPEAVFTIVGRNPAPGVRELAALPGVEVTGRVADVRPYYREAFASIVPLRSGGGTRLKILEAMAAGVPVASTALGAEGLAAQPGADYLAVESPEEMRQAVVRLERDPELWARLAAAGRRLVETRYDWSILGARLAELLLSLMRSRQAATAPGRES